MLVEPATLHAIANRGDDKGILVRKGTVYEGTLPNLIAQSEEWGGHRWTVLLWPLDKFYGEDVDLTIAHELFHGIQKDLGLWPEGTAMCPHLETPEGRIWLRLEMRALALTLASRGTARRKAMMDALAFRWKRRALFTEPSNAETRQELLEGLAEYTGIRTVLSPEPGKAQVIRKLKAADTIEHFSRSFAYNTGPAYGLLLDKASPRWRKTFRAPGDLPELLRGSLKIGVSSLPKAEDAAARYEGETVRTQELDRDTKHKSRVLKVARRFREGRVLRLPANLADTVKMGKTAGQMSIEELGVFQIEMRVTAPWGTLVANDGVLVDGQSFVVEAPQDLADKSPKGPGWTLMLKPGWAIVPGTRAGDWIVQPSHGVSD